MQPRSHPAPQLARRQGRLWHHRLVWILGGAAVIRILFLLSLADLELRMDEIQYQEIAVNLAEGRGFALHGQLTSWRPPLYPFVMAAVYGLTDSTDPQVIRVFQTLLSLFHIGLVYLLGRRLFGQRVGLGAACVFAFYPSFLFYNNHILTEGVFTFLLTCTAYCFVVYLQTRRLPALIASGAVLGVTVLARDIVWPMVIMMGLIAMYRVRPAWLVGIGHTVAVLLAFLVVVAPWVIRNTQLQGIFTLVATNGGIVFFEGNYEHTPLDRPWRSHALDPVLKVRRLLPQNVSEGERQRAAFSKGLAFIREHPGLTLHRSLIKAANVWGLERELVGTLLTGGYGQPSMGTVIAVSTIIFGVYVLTLLGGVTGFCYAFARAGQDSAFHVFFAILILLVTAAHALVFGHPRYHLPLMPLFAVYAAYAWTIRQHVWEERGSLAFRGACVLTSLLGVIWFREVVFVEARRFIQELVQI